MNKLEDFTEGSEWDDEIGHTLKFHSICASSNVPLFTCDNDNKYYSRDYNGITIGFIDGWKTLKKIEPCKK